MTATKQHLDRLWKLAEQMTKVIDEIDTINVQAFPEPTSAGAVSLEAIFLNVREQVADLHYFIDEQHKGLEKTDKGETTVKVSQPSIEEYFKARAQRVKDHAGMDLGTLHMLLDNYNPEDKLLFSNGAHLDGFYDSYRGYYEDIAFSFGSVAEHGIETVGQFVKMIEDAMSTGTMKGYKGGDYPITDATLAWLGNYGTTSGSMKIVYVFGMKGAVQILVKEDE